MGYCFLKQRTKSIVLIVNDGISQRQYAEMPVAVLIKTTVWSKSGVKKTSQVNVRRLLYSKLKCTLTKYCKLIWWSQNSGWDITSRLCRWTYWYLKTYPILTLASFGRYFKGRTFKTGELSLADHVRYWLVNKYKYPFSWMQIYAVCYSEHIYFFFLSNFWP